ncbi:MBL fold metallo-hydrolase [Algoriphagus sanaruensis]|uniref:MBL fold metallo-hydrolase n=1 Tax=Algoriphagus sanaruensis TaxID=1727163 RepID=A0A142ERE7_9BACT|nr:MBL fold metallo-hydrolase [Algoriphagus sanaruensis]AMQ57702.1 MBL fold metallo-hydrolase [Algoriphagus sanaruensis]
MIHIKSFTFNPFQENTYLVYTDSGETAIIDPGCHTAQERSEVQEFITSNGLNPILLLNTHCHIDHVLGNAWVKKNYKLELSIHPEEVTVLKSVEVYAPNYGFHGFEPTKADNYLHEGDLISLGKDQLKVLFVPGHAPGHVVFYHEGSKQAIVGDTLFRGSIGRTDLPGGNHQLLLQKIKSELFTLPEEVVLFPGHGPETTVGYEKLYNPFVGQRAIH